MRAPTRRERGVSPVHLGRSSCPSSYVATFPPVSLDMSDPAAIRTSKPQIDLLVLHNLLWRWVLVLVVEATKRYWSLVWGDEQKAILVSADSTGSWVECRNSSRRESMETSITMSCKGRISSYLWHPATWKQSYRELDYECGRVGSCLGWIGLPWESLTIGCIGGHHLKLTTKMINFVKLLDWWGGASLMFDLVKYSMASLVLT